ncbi:MAG TPA: hypothetical protein PKE39_06825 [Ignavibacteria bacterium]|nr:hypothetical protein [Ignavibacteria bacterium]HMQ98723.1 hypothetical protein [Ignavibacteria bacterium]
MKKPILIFALMICTAGFFTGCGVFGKKKFEDTDTYREMMRAQEETDKKLDSIRRENYKQLNDSVNNGFKRKLDSLKRSTDSLEKELEKSIQNLKNSR